MIKNFGGGKKFKWTVLKHNGPMFPPAYVPHRIPIIINNQPFIFPPEAEEMATLYSRYLGTEYLENARFKRNFWKDFKKVLPSGLETIIQSMDDLDLQPYKNHLEKEREKRLALSKDEKEKAKLKRDKVEEPFKYCIIDGAQQKVGNYKIEPPGIFMGRGKHPKIGRFKPRLRPEDVTINISKDAKIPKPNVPGEWQEVIHDREVVWLATWKDFITDKNKYIFTSVEATFKSKSDEKKFDLAKKVKRKIKSIRENYQRDLVSDDIKKKQLATALYFIDKLALRAGGKKDSKKQADTVGVTSLRVEHITFPERQVIKLDFLGKDSIRFCKKVNVSVEVYQNLQDFSHEKSRKDNIFDQITPALLNNYLDSQMKGLTAKVLRTFKASSVFQKEIDKINLDKVKTMDENQKLAYLIGMFNQANTEVAILCNHQKAANTNINEAIEKINLRIKEMKKKRKKYMEKKKREASEKLRNKIKLLKLKRDNKMRLKNISLGTSKNNYIDPRIIVSFTKKFDIPLEKILSKSWIKRFEWATKVDADYRF